MDHPSDTELAALAAGGDAGAFENLISRHYMLIYRVSYKWCGIKEDAEDITQEVLVKLARKLKTFKQHASFKTWLYRIAVNTAKDFTRKHSNKRAYESAYGNEQDVHITADNPGGSGNPGEGTSAPELYAAINELPIKQKEAVLLVYAEDMNHREAAQALGCAETTVSWRIFQAKKGLKKLLSKGD